MSATRSCMATCGRARVTRDHGATATHRRNASPIEPGSWLRSRAGGAVPHWARALREDSPGDMGEPGEYAPIASDVDYEVADQRAAFLAAVRSSRRL